MRGPIALCCVASIVLPGCGLLQRRPRAEAPENSIIIRAPSDDAVWELTAAVVSDYFPIARENRLDGIIETQPKTGAALFEPWHKDAATLEDRLEGTLQSVRRRAFVHVTPAPEQGGYLVSVEVFKEREDVVEPSTASAGSSTFQETEPLSQEQRFAIGRSSPDGWIPMGRDPALESAMLNDLQRRLAQLSRADGHPRAGRTSSR